MIQQTDNLNYEVFDRQLDNLIKMSEVLASETDDCGTQELTFDIISLQAKAGRLCYLADIDYAQQLSELIHYRHEKNKFYHMRFEMVVYKHISPMMMRVVSGVRETGTFEGHKSPIVSPVLSTFLPRLAELMSLDGVSAEQWELNTQSFAEVERMMQKHIKPAVLPGMKYQERLWRLCQYYAQLCYLLYHFQRVESLGNKDIVEEDAGRLLTAMIQRYAESEAGIAELQRFMAVLEYNNDNRPLTAEQLSAAQKALVEDVPQPLQLCYVRHIEDIDMLARELLGMNGEEEDIYQLISVIAKWQLLTSRINELSKPELTAKVLENEVFVCTRHGQTVDILQLKESIARMLPLVTRKNHWFCIWSVLRHHNLISNTSFEPFARQMMQKDWFGSIEKSKHFTGDTLREYAGYLANVDYTQWQSHDYLLYKERNNKSRWSDTLWRKFQHLCYEMDEVFRG